MHVVSACTVLCLCMNCKVKWLANVCFVLGLIRQCCKASPQFHCLILVCQIIQTARLPVLIDASPPQS